MIWTKKDRNLSKRLTQKYLLALGILAALSVSSYFILSRFLEINKADAYMINLSGNQRFLTQRIPLYALRLVNAKDSLSRNSLRKDLLNQIDILEELHAILEESNQIIVHNKIKKVYRYRSPEVRSIYFGSSLLLDKKIHDYIAEARRLANAPDSLLTLDNDHLNNLLATNTALLHSTDLIVDNYQKMNEDSLNTLLRVILLIILVTLFALVIIGLLLFMPMVKEIKNDVEELNRKEYELRNINNNLEERIEERTAELRNTNRFLVKEIDEHLLTSNQLKLLSNAVEQTDDTVIITNTNGIIHYVNTSFINKTGFSKEEVIGKDPSIIKSGKHENAFYSELWKTLKRGEIYKNIIINRKKNGELYWEEKTISPIKVGSNEFTHYVAVGKDITERMKSEELIQEANIFNRTLLQTIPLGIQVIDRDGEVLFRNDYLAVKTTAGNVVGKKCYELIRAQSNNPFLQDIITMGKVEMMEINCPLDGNKTVQVYYTGIEYKKKKAILEVFVDITNLKETEKKLIERNIELNTFIYRASHDIRGPLSSILGLTNLAKIEVKDKTILQYFDYIKKSTERLDTMLLELLLITKVKENSLEISAIDFQQMVDEIEKSLKHGTAETVVIFRKNIVTNTVFNSDKKLVYSVMQNLIDNAIKYRRHNIPDPSVSVKIYDYEGGVKIEIEDNGIGMNEEVQKKVFDMFYRGDERSQGTGLGLYIVKSTVEKIQGTIELKSERNKGSLFTVYLPSLS